MFLMDCFRKRARAARIFFQVLTSKYFFLILLENRNILMYVIFLNFALESPRAAPLGCARQRPERDLHYYPARSCGSASRGGAAPGLRVIARLSLGTARGQLPLGHGCAPGAPPGPASPVVARVSFEPGFALSCVRLMLSVVSPLGAF